MARGLHKLIRMTCCLVAAGLLSMPPSHAQADHKPSLVTVMHYFSDELGRDGLNRIFGDYLKTHEVTVFDNPSGHEDFKHDILELLQGGYPPDTFSYWAGARTDALIRQGMLNPLDDLWEDAQLGNIVIAPIAGSATYHNGKRYLIPFGYHYAAVFYNPALFRKAGIDHPPGNWDDFLSLCQRLKNQGITPIALGSENRWPAQFWFDYLILQTAGPAYRAKLMAGQAAYTDPEVQKAFGLWRDLILSGYFNDTPNANSWTDAADQVASGQAAMTLMGTWVTGYWQKKGLAPLTEYDFFPFPKIDGPKIDGERPVIAVGAVDGFVIPAESQNIHQAEHLLDWLVSDKKTQSDWVKTQGALSPNKNIDRSVYSPVMQKALDQIKQVDTFVFNYDLATPPAIADIGLQLFVDFIDQPDQLSTLLISAQKAIADADTKQ